MLRDNEVKKMIINKCTKPSFEVIGKEGSTDEGPGFFKNLWKEATDNFAIIEKLAVRDPQKGIKGAWGIMSDKSRSFRPWENNFSEGLYLAGIECIKGSEVPDGFKKWIVPGSEYIYVLNEGADTFMNVINYMKENAIPLVGAAYDYSSFEDGKDYIYFPIKRL